MKALILTGGKSSRMGTDKASLKIGDQTLLERTISLILPLTKEIFLSVAHPSLDTSTFNVERSTLNVQLLPDLKPSPGPLGGLQAALQSDPTSDWLLIACDLPRISAQDLSALIDNHHPEKDVTCFLNPLDNHPEPLCALYSPSASEKLSEAITSNRRCARKFLRNLERTELVPADPQALLNLNRPEHLAELEHLHQHGPVEKTLTIEYFAKLSQEAGTSSEEVTTTSATLTGLWEEVRLRHHFSLDLPHVKPAINNEFADWETPLTAGDQIAFMPPFAGG
ncbi:NTP transferase domain-containing protein [Akkermansiaceae bacterium]|nr:NTP transferase domain-containing protein [Akkermansiaceae bacterium]MDB4537261.1 NTP transferase domain-containing protein [Akkermansiaceae bacterium]